MQPKDLLGDKDWRKLYAQSVINLYKNNQANGLVYGPLGSLSVAEVDYLHKLGIATQIDEDFYTFSSLDSQITWEQLKKTILSSFLQGKAFRASNRDIVASGMNKYASFVTRYESSWESIQTIPITTENKEIYLKVINFEKQYLNGTS